MPSEQLDALLAAGLHHCGSWEMIGSVDATTLQPDDPSANTLSVTGI
ncbi:MAG: hypothetical protein IPH35_18345 [Rhodoferax sp.]|nr:hypothetical protein [Rhodoferax sp.]